MIPLMLYGVSAAVAAYFLHHAHNGARGIEAQQKYEAQVAELSQELDGLKTQRTEWERRIALLRSDQIDRDLLEERARIMLGRVHPNDLVIITGPN
ncbi:cell division protein FtsB [Microvirga flocculans]|uniref:Cell division protein FtsB n=1 Tax=Microvirga flocculans TaxID=217168 RepID=A0A7W6IG09_9HYPH|nr:cell division protein FtsB [Microvirga flocculans]